MRKLILFLVRYNTAILFLLLQVTALSIIFNTQIYQSSAFYSLNAEWSGRVMSVYKNIDNYLNLAEINESLARENANLRSANKDAYFSLVAKKDTIIDSLFTQQYSYIEARVINSSFTKHNNYITINKGSRHGIKPDMAVTSASGVIGVVKKVSPHFASVLPLVHSRSLLSASFKNNKHFGSLSWDGKNHRTAQLSDIPREAEFVVGDTLVTDSRSLAFPSNLFLGTVKDFTLNQEDQTYSINLNLGVDFSFLDFVYVIDNVLKIEQQNLEQEIAE